MQVFTLSRRARRVAPRALLLPILSGAICLLSAARPAPAADDRGGAGGVHDNARIFSQDAVARADEAIAGIKARHGHELLVETFPAVPEALQNDFKSKPKEQFYTDWAGELGRAGHVRGVVLLIVMNPGHLQIDVGAETQKKLFTLKDRQDMQAPLNEAMKEKQYDEALARTVAFVQKRMDANDPNAAPAAAPTAPNATAAPNREPAAAGRAGGTAVVYLDRVAQAVGWQETMTTEVEAADKSLKQQRDAYVAQLDQALKDRKKELADAARLPAEQADALGRAGTPEELEKVPLPAEQRYALFLALGAVGQARDSAEAGYKAALDRYRAALLDSYQAAVKPAVKAVATQGGFTLVVSPRDNLIYVDPSADVTDRVAEALKKEMPQHAPPEAPKLDLPAFRLSPLAAPAAEKPVQK